MYTFETNIVRWVFLKPTYIIIIVHNQFESVVIELLDVQYFYVLISHKVQFNYFRSPKKQFEKLYF